MPDGDYASDPAEGKLADVARSGAREWQRDMAAWETDAEMLRLRQRSLTNVLWEAMQRGDVVSVAVAGHTFAGSVVACRQDLAVLVNGDLYVALNVAAIDSVHLQRGGDGVAGDRTYGSLRAYLGMLEVEGTEVRVLGRDVDVRGNVEVVADDHVLLRGTDGTIAVAIRGIAAIIPDG